MMPMATPANAIVFARGRVTNPHMARARLLINLPGASVINLLLSTCGTGVPGLGVTFSDP